VAKEALLVKVGTSKGQYSVEEEVEMSVTVENQGLSPLELLFTTAQKYDFIVSKGGREIWRWSTDKMFAMVIEQFLLKPNEKQTFTDKWKPIDLPPGEYKVIGVIMSSPHLEGACKFKVCDAK
jgi:hypothetical protein